MQAHVRALGNAPAQSPEQQAALIYSWLTPDQQEAVFTQGRLLIPMRSLTDEQQAMTRRIFDEVSAANAADNAGQPPRDREGELNQHGIDFQASRQNGRTTLMVQVGQ